MRTGVLRQFTACFVSLFSVLIVGQALAWPSPVIYNIRKKGNPMTMNNMQIELMASMIYIGNLFSPIPSAKLMDTIGRKNALHVLSIVPFCSWALVYLAVHPSLLFLARAVIGCWMGIVYTVLPTYLAEVSQANIRGVFSFLFQLMIWLGVIFSNAVGSQVDFYNFSLILGVFPVLLFLLMFLIPESPYWYTKVGKHDLAAKSLSWLRGENLENLSEELADIRESMTQADRRKTSYSELLATKGNKRALLIVLVIAVAERASGASALKAYFSSSIPEGGIISPNNGAIVNSMVGCLGILLSTFLVDIAGRKPLLIGSTIGCGTVMTTAALWYFLDAKTAFCVKAFNWVPFISIIAYSFFFNIGLGPIEVTLQGELFPTNIKAYASGIAAIVLSLVSFTSNMIFVDIVDFIGMYFNFVLFASASFGATIFACYYLIETKGKTLSQIQKELNE